MNTIVTLVASNNKRLKQLIKQHGNQWEMISEPQTIQCADGLCVKVRSLDKSHERWVLYPQEIVE